MEVFRETGRKKQYVLTVASMSKDDNETAQLVAYEYFDHGIIHRVAVEVKPDLILAIVAVTLDMDEAFFRCQFFRAEDYAFAIEWLNGIDATNLQRKDFWWSDD